MKNKNKKQDSYHKSAVYANEHLYQAGFKMVAASAQPPFLRESYLANKNWQTLYFRTTFFSVIIYLFEFFSSLYIYLLFTILLIVKCFLFIYFFSRSSNVHINS